MAQNTPAPKLRGGSIENAAKVAGQVVGGAITRPLEVGRLAVDSLKQGLSKGAKDNRQAAKAERINDQRSSITGVSTLLDPNPSEVKTVNQAERGERWLDKKGMMKRAFGFEDEEE